MKTISQATIAIWRAHFTLYHIGIATGTAHRTTWHDGEYPLDRLAECEAELAKAGYRLMSEPAENPRWYQRITDNGALAENV